MCGILHELGEVATHSWRVEGGAKVLVLKIQIGGPRLRCFGHDMCLTLGNLGSNLVRLFFFFLRKNVCFQLHSVATVYKSYNMFVLDQSWKPTFLFFWGG